jgi:hypothetical protein
MIIELTLPPFGSARVWFNEHPALASESTRVLMRTLAASPRIRTMRRAGVELFVPAGALADYALLCGHFVPNDLGQLTLELPVCSEPGEHLSWSLAAAVDEVRAGLPEEYAQSVLDAAAAPEVLGSGTLVLTPAAHAMVGSSPRMFSRVTSALLDIMALNTEDVTNELLGRILQSRLE